MSQEFWGAFMGAFIAVVACRALGVGTPRIIERTKEAVERKVEEMTRPPSVYMPPMTQKEREDMDKPGFMEKLGLHKPDRD